jgi:hypothetical protein
VKEHYSQQSSALRGFLGRSPLIYDLIEGLPGTSFIRYDEKLTSLVAEASYVFTLTGTIAIEAVLKGTPVVYFGTPWWEGLPGTFRMSESLSFSSVDAEEVPRPSVILDFLGDLVVNSAILGFASEPVDTIVKRFGTLPRDFLTASALQLAHCVVSLVSPR